MHRHLALLAGAACALVCAATSAATGAAVAAPAAPTSRPAHHSSHHSAQHSSGHPAWWPTVAHSKAIASAGAARNARLTIPRIGIHQLPVIAYHGSTDDAPGTRIQNRGIAAASIGRPGKGGVGPGGIGNYLIAGHRTSHGGVFGRTPSLPKGAKILVDAGRWRYVYRVVRTRWVDFRSQHSLKLQRSAVPGHPGKKANRAWLTLSTCATPEDHAAGDFWTDRLGNPQHRIDKVAVLAKRKPRR